MFESDSEDDETKQNNQNNNTIEEKIEQLRQELSNITDSECEDVLEITIDNEHFTTPNKVHQHTQDSFSISPVVIGTHTFETPKKPTHTHTIESLTPQSSVFSSERFSKHQYCRQ